MLDGWLILLIPAAFVASVALEARSFRNHVPPEVHRIVTEDRDRQAEKAKLWYDVALLGRGLKVETTGGRWVIWGAADPREGGRP